MHSLQLFLNQEEHYLQSIDSYVKGFADKNMLEKSAFLLEQKYVLAKNMAQAIKTESYRFKDVKQSRLEISQRKKKLFIFSVEDMVMIKTMLAAIAPTFATTCSTQLYSYIKNRSVHQPIASFLKFQEEHKKKNNNKVDLYLHKTDLHHFYESIPVHNHSVIWSKLDNLLRSADRDHELPSFIQELYHYIVRPTFNSTNANLMTNIYGIPYGSPFSGLLGNLYVEDVDNLIKKKPDMFYSRYSDDILLAHADRELVLSVVAEIHNTLQELELTCTSSKERWIYLTKSGSPLADEAIFQGSNSFPYLGCIIHATGKTHSTNRKAKFLFSLCAEIIEKSNQLASDKPVNERGKLIAQQLKHELLSQDNRLIQQLFLKTNDHEYLRELDKKIAIKFAETLTGHEGIKAFRILPYKSIREEFGLPSLEQLRNRLN